MCGIAGIVSKAGGGVDAARLEEMTRLVAHRGPDDEGLLIEGPVGLGHRRLSIIDLSAAGRQPMTLAGTSLTIVYNGEVYNYVELREELIANGRRFRTGTDTEVILAAYAAWGPSCVSKFNGMWAFAIFDRERNVIFCSRDRFGIKPFYYASTPTQWCFGSEIRQLLPALPAIRPNRRVVLDFILAAVTEPTEETFFEGVHKLPGGHNAIYDIATHRLKVERYYEIVLKDGPEREEMAAAAQGYGELLSSAVRMRLRADVRVGTCLSGGLDSSSVATLASPGYRAARGEPFRAITAISESPHNDESGYAKLVAERGGMQWIPVEPRYDGFVESLPHVVRAQEEPFAGPSINMQFFVMQSARQHGTPVLLDGQGGDETLLGYERYFACYFLDRLRRKGFAAAVAAMLGSWRNNAKMSPAMIIQYLVYFSSARLRYWLYCYRNRYLRRRPPMPERMKVAAEAVSSPAAMQKREIETTNLPALLRYEDKNSMWHGIETRLPFLDYRLVERALSLPGETKIHEGWTKYVLRRFMADKLPPEIAWRRNKLGFEAPDALWIGKHVGVMSRKVLSSKLILSLSRGGKLRRLYGRLDRGTQWRLYSVALWEEEFSVGTDEC